MKRTPFPLMLGLLTFGAALLAACGQQTVTPPAATASGPSGTARLSLRLPYFPRLDPAAGPQAQYVNAAATTRLTLSVDGGPAQDLTGPALSCVQADDACSATLNLTPGAHTLSLTTYGGSSAISGASQTVTVLEGQANSFAVTLKPLNLTASLAFADGGAPLLAQPDGSRVLARSGSYPLTVTLKDAVGGSVPLAGNASLCSDASGLSFAGASLTASGFSATSANIWVVAGADCTGTRLSSLALHAEGSLKWSVSPAAGASPSAALALAPDGTVYMPSGDGHLYALKPDGTLKWASPQLGASLVNAPALAADGTVYVSADATLYALDPATGAQKWQDTPGNLIYAAPSVAADGTVYIGTLDGNLYAVNPATGADSLKFNTTSNTTRTVFAGAVLGGSLFVSALDSDQNVSSDQVYAVNPVSGAQQWARPLQLTYASPALGAAGLIVPTADDLVRALDPNTGAVLWSSGVTTESSNASPVLDAAGNVYLATESGQLYARTPSGGARWNVAVGASVAAAPLVGQDQTVYVVASDGLKALNPDGSLRWSGAVAGWSFGNLSGSGSGSTGFDLSPVLAPGGTLYTGADDGKVYALYTLSDGLSGGHWPKAHHDNRNSGQD